MIISITGDAGSGKSTIAKMLAEKLKMKRYYVGGMRREMAKRRNVTLEAFNKLGEEKDFTDKEVDEWQEKLGKDENNFIIEGRTSFHFIPQALKIYLLVDEKEGARRIWSHLKEGAERNEADNLKSLDDVLASIRIRRASDDKRYKKYYGLDAHDKTKFDFVIDTTNKSISEVFQETYNYIKSQYSSD